MANRQHQACYARGRLLGWATLSLGCHLIFVFAIVLWVPPLSLTASTAAHEVELQSSTGLTLIAQPAVATAPARSGAAPGNRCESRSFGSTTEEPSTAGGVVRSRHQLTAARVRVLESHGEPAPFVERFGDTPADPVATSSPAAGVVARGLTRIGKDGISPLSELCRSCAAGGSGIAASEPDGGSEARGTGGGKVLWLNGRDRRYTTYFQTIYEKVDRLWKFPKSLEILFEQGDVLVQFTIVADGNVRELRVRKSSGMPQFDRNVVAAIRRAAPFDPIPRGLGRSLRIMAPFEFSNPMVR